MHSIAIVSNEEHAQVIARSGIALSEILSFCPIAKYTLEKKGYKVRANSDFYGSLSHAKNVVITHQTLDRIVESASGYDLGEAEKLSLRVYLYYCLSICYLIYFSARSYKNAAEFVWVEDGKIHRSPHFSALYESLVFQAIAHLKAHANQTLSPAHAFLARLSNRISHYYLSRQKKRRVLCFGNPFPWKIARAVAAQEDSVIIYPVSIHRQFSKTLGVFFKMLIRFACKKHKGVVTIYRIAPALPDSPQPPLILPIKEALINGTATKIIHAYIPFLRKEYRLGGALVERYTPDLAIGDHGKYPYIVGALEALSNRNITALMINHATYTKQESIISKMAMEEWSRQNRMVTRYNSDFAPKSPLTLELAKSIMPGLHCRIHKINNYGKTKIAAYNPAEPFLILHAGNYGDLPTTIPHCIETPFEYLYGILELIDEVKTIDNAQLIIKLKAAKSDVHYRIIDDYIKQSGAIRVTIDTAGKFADLLAKTHLLISNLSGTLEEAAINNMPTLLYTYRKKYFHFPCSFHPAGDALIYGVKDKKDVVPMIRSIMARHALLLTQKNTGIAWQENELTTPAGLATALLAHSPSPRTRP